MIPTDLIACLKRPQDHEHDWRLIFADAAKACELANASIKDLEQELQAQGERND